MKLVEQGVRMSGTTDEWTATLRRFSCVNIHIPGGESVRLGLVRVKGSLPAEKAAEDFCQKLNDYGLEEKKMVAGTTDAASVMVKMGSLLNMYHQLCYAHGIHLGKCHNCYL